MEEAKKATIADQLKITKCLEILGFPKVLGHLVSEYTIIPKSYSFPTAEYRGVHNMIIFTHAVCGDLCLMHTSKCLYVYSTSQNWSLIHEFDWHIYLGEHDLIMGICKWRNKLLVITYATLRIHSFDINGNIEDWYFDKDPFGLNSVPTDCGVINDLCLIAGTRWIYFYSISLINNRCVFNFERLIHLKNDVFGLSIDRGLTFVNCLSEIVCINEGGDEIGKLYPSEEKGKGKFYYHACDNGILCTIDSKYISIHNSADLQLVKRVEHKKHKKRLQKWYSVCLFKRVLFILRVDSMLAVHLDDFFNEKERNFIRESKV
jgi:hypothetical protein